MFSSVDCLTSQTYDDGGVFTDLPVNSWIFFSRTTHSQRWFERWHNADATDEPAIVETFSTKSEYWMNFFQKIGDEANENHSRALFNGRSNILTAKQSFDWKSKRKSCNDAIVVREVNTQFRCFRLFKLAHCDPEVEITSKNKKCTKFIRRLCSQLYSC